MSCFSRSRAVTLGSGEAEVRDDARVAPVGSEIGGIFLAQEASVRIASIWALCVTDAKV